MDDYELRNSRSPKRRRVNGRAYTHARYSSPDELAASSDHETSYVRRTSNTTRHDSGDIKRRSYTGTDSDDSPDELDHTVHTFYRDSRSRGRGPTTSASAPSREDSTHTVRPRSPPVKKKTYLPYRQKLILKGHRKGVAAVKFSPDGRCIASCCKLIILSRTRDVTNHSWCQPRTLPSEYGRRRMANCYIS